MVLNDVFHLESLPVLYGLLNVENLFGSVRLKDTIYLSLQLLFIPLYYS